MAAAVLGGGVQAVLLLCPIHVWALELHSKAARVPPHEEFGEALPLVVLGRPDKAIVCFSDNNGDFHHHQSCLK
jgi:hypothetical protein